MIYLHTMPAYATWAPVVVRVIAGLIFLMSAYYKIPGSEMFNFQVGMSGEAGIPLPYLAVLLAFVLELVGGIALVIGWQTRLFSFLLAGFVMLVALFFYRNIADQTTFGLFISCVTQASLLVLLSVYGTQKAAVMKESVT